MRHRFRPFAFALLLITVALFASGQKSVEVQKPTGSVAGKVLDAVDGTPIKGADIYLHGEPIDPKKPSEAEQHTARSSADGTFAFEKVAAGRYDVTISKPGFSSFRSSSGGQPTQVIAVTVTADQTLNQEFHLMPSAVIVGRVVDDEGSPVEHMRVDVRKWTFTNGKRRLTSGASGDWVPRMTNDLGEYRVYGLLPGRYYVVVSPVWMGGSSAGRFVKTYYQNSRDIDDATPIVLGPGDEARADFTLARLPGVKVKGMLTGAGIENYTTGEFIVQFKAQGESSVLMTGVKADGSFERESVVPGNYEIIVSTIDYGEERAGPKEVARVQVEVPPTGLDSLRIPVTPVSREKGEIRGVVTSSDKEFRPGGFFVVVEQNASSDDDEERNMNTSAYATTKPDGSFTLNSPEAGEYKVRAFERGFGATGKWFMASIEFNGRDYTYRALTLPTSATGNLRITMSSKSATLEGTVSNAAGKPVPQAQILMLPSDNNQRPDLYPSGQADQNGSFKLRGIVPYSYKVVALADEDADAAADPNFLKSLGSRGTSVHLDPGAKQTVTLKVTTDAPQQ